MMKNTHHVYQMRETLGNAIQQSLMAGVTEVFPRPEFRGRIEFWAGKKAQGPKPQFFCKALQPD